MSRLSRPEKGLQKRVNLMQQTTNSDLSRHYLPRQLRHLILQEYLSGVKTARQLSEEHGIPMSTIHKMGQRWKAKNSCSFVSTPNPFPIMSRVTRKKPVNCYPRTKPFGGTWKRLYYVWKAMRSWEISSRKIRYRPAKKIRSRTVQRLKERHTAMSLSFLCGLFGYTRQAYYKHLRRNREGSLSDTLLLERVGYYRKLMPRLGGRKLWHLLQQDGFPVSRDRLFTLLSENNLLVKRRKKYSVTTCSRHWMRKYPNLIRGFDLERPHRLWVGDITYISLKGGFAYLALITDAYSKRIVGYDLNTTLERDGALRALRMAIDQTPQQKRQGLIHHSDRGCQYCSKEYVKLLTDNGIRISMTEKGDPYENAVAERVNGILKSEWIDEECFESFQAAKERIDQIVILYNSLRPHASCDWLTPLEAELRTGKLKHHWGRKTVVRKAYVNLYQDNIF